MVKLENTIKALNEKFIDLNGAINTAYLEDLITINIIHTRNLQNALYNSRQSIKGIVWNAFIMAANEALIDADYTTEAASDHLKKWLKMHNADYSILAPIIAQMTEFRNENKQ